MKWQNSTKLKAFLFSLIFIVPWLVTDKIQADTSTAISSTVQLSVCGNGIIEGGEDCEKSIGTTSCITLGYGSGILSCDIACSYDTTNCSLIGPTLTPAPQPVTSTSVLSPTTVVVTTNLPTVPLFSLPIESTSNLPDVLKAFDLDNNGIIDSDEIFTVVRIWVDNFREPEPENCDINQDGVCDLRDLSVILFHVK